MDEKFVDSKDDEVKINIYGLIDDEEKLDVLTKFLGTSAGRKVARILIESEKGEYKGGISNQMDISYSATSHHVSHAEDAGLIIKSKRKIRKKGIKHTHYKIPKQLIIIPLGFDKQEINSPRAIKKLIKNGINFLVETPKSTS